MTTTMARMQQRRGAAADWAADNPVLFAGEIGYDEDARAAKMGDGSTAWNALPWLIPPTETWMFRPETYGAFGDGVADDTAAVQAAYDAAHTAGGGLVILSQRYGWKGDLLHRGAIRVSGVGLRKQLVTDDLLDRGLVALDGSARYRYGQWTGDSADDNPGPLECLVINGANVGGSSELFKMECVDGSIVDTHIVFAAGNCVEVGGAQNSTFDRCFIGGAVSGASIHLLNLGGQGAGQIKFNNTYVQGSGGGMLVGDTDPAQFYPHDIMFSACLFENRIPGANLAALNAGDWKFDRCTFTNSQDGTIPAANTLFKISQTSQPTFATTVEFRSCYFNGGGNATKPLSAVLVDSTAGAGNIVRFTGHTSVTNVQALVGVAGPTVASLVSVEDTVYRSTGVAWFTTAPGGSLAGVYRKTSSPLKFAIEDGHADLIDPITVKYLNDAQDRFRIAADGTERHFNGTDLTVRGSRTYDAASDSIVIGGIQQIANALNLRPLLSLISVDTAVTFVYGRTSGPAGVLAFTASGKTVTLTMDGATDGAQFQIVVYNSGVTGNKIVWPSNIAWQGVAPQPPDNGVMVINLVSFAGIWLASDKPFDASVLQIASNQVTTGMETYSRDFADQLNTAALSGQVSFTYFTATKAMTVASLRTAVGNTPAAATPTLCRMGLYTVAANGDLTLVASTPNDTTLWAAATTIYTKALSASYSLVAGQRYAFASLCVSSAALPTLVAHTPSSILAAEAPRLCGQLGSQTDLPASVAAASVGTTSRRVYGELL